MAKAKRRNLTVDQIIDERARGSAAQAKLVGGGISGGNKITTFKGSPIKKK